MYGQHFQQSIDQSTGYGCQSCSWSAEQGNKEKLCSRSRVRILSLETRSAVPTRVSPLILYTQAESDWLVLNHGISPLILHTQAESDWLVLNRGIPRAFRDGAHMIIPSTVIGSLPSLSGHAIVYRWRSLPRVHRHSASSPQGGS